LPQRKRATRVSEVQPLLRCRGCGLELRSSAETRWECECGVAVCHEDTCFEEYFKLLSDGETTRCRSCGNVL
jgi:hypothetical protein